MGYDPFDVVWSPRVGDTGDDVYNVPGATKINGTVDDGELTPIAAGPSTYSTPPTIEEINAGSGFNQVIAMINKRAIEYNDAFGTAIGTLDYLASDAAVRASTTWTAIKNAIDNLRSGEGLSAYTWASGGVGGGSSGWTILGSHLAHLRKALRCSGVLTRTLSHCYVYPQSSRLVVWQRLDSDPEGTTKISETVTTDTNLLASYSAYLTVGLVLRYLRLRTMFSVPVPSWLNGADYATVAAGRFGNLYNSTPPVFYSSNVPALSGTVGEFAGVDNYEGIQKTVVSNGTTTVYAAVPPDRVSDFAGGYMTFIMAAYRDAENLGYDADRGGYNTTVSTVSFEIGLGD